MTNIDLSNVPTEELDKLLEYARELELIKRQREALAKKETVVKKKAENTYDERLTEQARKMLAEGYIVSPEGIGGISFTKVSSSEAPEVRKQIKEQSKITLKA